MSAASTLSSTTKMRQSELTWEVAIAGIGNAYAGQRWLGLRLSPSPDACRQHSHRSCLEAFKWLDTTAAVKVRLGKAKEVGLPPHPTRWV